ncbi:MAG: hypothetical protein WCI02_09470 [Planctomycetota bacterium]
MPPKTHHSSKKMTTVERHPPPHFQAPAPATSPLKALLIVVYRFKKVVIGSMHWSCLKTIRHLLSDGRLAQVALVSEPLVGEVVSGDRYRLLFEHKDHCLTATFQLFRLVGDGFDATTNNTMKDMFGLNLHHPFPQLNFFTRFVFTGPRDHRWNKHRPLPTSHEFVGERLQLPSPSLEPVTRTSLQEIFAISKPNPIEWIAIYPMVESATARTGSVGQADGLGHRTASNRMPGPDRLQTQIDYRPRSITGPDGPTRSHAGGLGHRIRSPYPLTSPEGVLRIVALGR